jgi:hypothetical protein
VKGSFFKRRRFLDQEHLLRESQASNSGASRQRHISRDFLRLVEERRNLWAGARP